MFEWLISHPYTTAFVLVALITKKDLAVFCAMASISGAMVWDQYSAHPMVFAILAGINTLVVIMAAWYNAIHRTILSKSVMVLCTLGVCVNGWQLIGINQFNYWVSVSLGVSLMACLLFMDGRKGLLNGLWADMRDSVYRHVHLFGHKNNNGLHHK